nr:unnamed protein product [Callosobruchus chinensis]
MPLPSSYSPNYFSIEDILATQERTPCKFLHNVPKMGKLNPSAAERDLKAGTCLELPLWLVMEMSAGRQPIITPELPKVYRESYREILKADACAVDLHKYSLHFMKLDLIYRNLMDLADHSVSDPSVQHSLDTLEKKIFLASHAARTKLNSWLIQSGSPLEAAELVVNHKKRKRVDVDDMK